MDWEQATASRAMAHGSPIHIEQPILTGNLSMLYRVKTGPLTEIMQQAFGFGAGPAPGVEAWFAWARDGSDCGSDGIVYSATCRILNSQYSVKKKTLSGRIRGSAARAARQALGATPRLDTRWDELRPLLFLSISPTGDINPIAAKRPIRTITSLSDTVI
jgi:hypothetical protein